MTKNQVEYHSGLIKRDRWLRRSVGCLTMSHIVACIRTGTRVRDIRCPVFPDETANTILPATRLRGHRPMVSSSALATIIAKSVDCTVRDAGGCYRRSPAEDVLTSPRMVR